MSVHIENLKMTFRNAYPEWAKELESANNQNEIVRLQEKFMTETKNKLAAMYGKSPSELDETDVTGCIGLKPSQYKNLTKGSGEQMKDQIIALCDALTRLSKMGDYDSATVAATIAGAGLIGIGVVALGAYKIEMLASGLEDIAIIAGVTFATVAVVCTIALVCVVAIIIPIIYFMSKPAACIIVLINELDVDLITSKSNQYNEHGKPQLITTPIAKVFASGTEQQRFIAGFIATTKRDNALVGTTYGIQYKLEDSDSPSFAFATECPLTTIYGGNNCYCAFDQSAKDVAETTHSLQRLSYSDTQGPLGISIRCNSYSGSVAYYVGRVYLADQD